MPELNVLRLKEVLQDFYTATHFRIGLLDCSMHEQMCGPEVLSPFCTLIRQDPDVDEKIM